MYELFDHTADLGLRIRAADLNALFAEAGLALLAALVENPDAVRDTVRVEVKLPAEDHVDLLYDWLKAILYQVNGEGMLCSRFVVHVADSGLIGEAWGEPIDPTRHELSHEVKAITYHELKVEPSEGGWLAEVIVDI